MRATYLVAAIETAMQRNRESAGLPT